MEAAQQKREDIDIAQRQLELDQAAFAHQVKLAADEAAQKEKQHQTQLLVLEGAVKAAQAKVFKND